MKELSRKELPIHGVEMTTSKDGRQLQFAHAGYRVNGNRLGRSYSMAGVAKGLGIEAGILMTRAMEDDRER